ncbi:MAG: DUF2156 domain-containing protein [Methylotenera sp.]|nr:DUF2156 domain-containing protein [Oligoflexia bacterium]
MPFLQSPAVFERYRKDARNSSHFVWFLTSLQYFETPTDRWIFGFQKFGKVTLLALEPLIPESPTGSEAERLSNFERAWREFREAVQPEISAFIAVYTPFKEVLFKNQFQTLRIGQEPWVDLADCIPTGNAGKGVRGARNQALRAGVTVEEWTAEKIRTDPQKEAAIRDLYRLWKERNLIHIGGFLNATDPMAHAECRRYFIARSAGGRIEGYLVATPVGGIQSYFLEDLVLLPHACRGSAELLTLEALVSLHESGAKLASLGVVSVNAMSADGGQSLPPAIQFITVRLPALLQKFYNFNGLETFRKRFKPRHWENIFLAVQNHHPDRRSDAWAWLHVLGSLLPAFRPRLQLSRQWIRDAVIGPFERYPISWGVGLISFICFGAVNHFGHLPDWALLQFGFSGDAPFGQWFYRTFTSDFLYFEPLHFWFTGAFLIVLLRWTERTHSFRFTVGFFLTISFLDDFLDHTLIHMPFQFLRPELYARLIRHKDVGGSLLLVALIGLQLTQLRRNREIIFALVAFSSVFGFLFHSFHFHELIVDLNHFVFVTIGFITGKVMFELDRREKRAGAKRKPPEGRSVAAPAQKKPRQLQPTPGEKTQD